MKSVTLLTVLYILFLGNSSFATIDVIVKTPECIVFASDSRTTASSTAISSDTYEKIVKVTDYIMVQMGGKAYPGNKNIKTTIQDFKWEYNIKDTSKIYIDSLTKLFRDYCENKKSLSVKFGDLNIKIAGPDNNGNMQSYEYLPTLDTIFYRKDFYGVMWSGTKNVIQRLIRGIA
jgi:20S proteasome alpha/beta subunit